MRRENIRIVLPSPPQTSHARPQSPSPRPLHEPYVNSSSHSAPPSSPPPYQSNVSGPSLLPTTPRDQARTPRALTTHLQPRHVRSSPRIASSGRPRDPGLRSARSPYCLVGSIDRRIGILPRGSWCRRIRDACWIRAR